MGVQTCALPIFASSFGWRWAFVSVALFGLFMGVLYPLVVTNKRLGISKASADSQLAPGRARIDFRELATRSEEHTSELQSLMRISYAVFCLKKKKNKHLNPLH